ncbi:hypothetical protein Tco_1575881 [Tanacetum coccineum]
MGDIPFLDTDEEQPQAASTSRQYRKISMTKFVNALDADVRSSSTRSGCFTVAFIQAASSRHSLLCVIRLDPVTVAYTGVPWVLIDPGGILQDYIEMEGEESLVSGLLTSLEANQGELSSWFET